MENQYVKIVHDFVILPTANNEELSAIKRSNIYTNPSTKSMGLVKDYDVKKTTVGPESATIVFFPSSVASTVDCIPLFVYILSDDNIDKFDWFFNMKDNCIEQNTINKVILNPSKCKKIIATNDWSINWVNKSRNILKELPYLNNSLIEDIVNHNESLGKTKSYSDLNKLFSIEIKYLCNENFKNIIINPDNILLETKLINKNNDQVFHISDVIELLIAERERAVKIAYAFHKKNSDDYESKVKAEKIVYGNNTEKLKKSLAFIKRDIAEECRLIGNSISGSNALSHAVGETMKDRILIDYKHIFNQKTIEK